jgi:hypothetical protein
MVLTTIARVLAAATACAALCGCVDRAVPPADRPAETKAAAGFVNKVWTVRESPGVAPGTLYVFLSEGTLVITSRNSKPMLGKWTRDGTVFTMVEEGTAYKIDIVTLTADEFKILSHNPGGALEITLVPAPQS